jgi:hypothetical protein
MYQPDDKQTGTSQDDIDKKQTGTSGSEILQQWPESFDSIYILYSVRVRIIVSLEYLAFEHVQLLLYETKDPLYQRVIEADLSHQILRAMTRIFSITYLE